MGGSVKLTLAPGTCFQAQEVLDVTVGSLPLKNIVSCGGTSAALANTRAPSGLAPALVRSSCGVGFPVAHAPRVGALGVQGVSEVIRIRRLVGVRDRAGRVRLYIALWVIV